MKIETLEQATKMHQHLKSLQFQLGELETKGLGHISTCTKKSTALMHLDGGDDLQQCIIAVIRARIAEVKAKLADLGIEL